MRDAISMTTWQSLLYCVGAEVTLDRIKNLVSITGTESLTVDFKEGGRTATIAECAAAMANAHGGLIFVGITDQERDIVGVPREAMAHVADVLATHLESPDWAPEMIEIPLGDDKPDRYVLVIRINRDTAPRPVFVQRRGGIFWAPIRMPGATRQATRDELYTLFTEPGPGDTPDEQWDFHRPDIPLDREGRQDERVDLVMLSGLRVPVAPEARGRPLSQRVLGELAEVLDQSALERTLFRLTGLGGADIEKFHPEGQANRSNIATLVWRIEPDEGAPFEMTVRIEVPGHYGRSHVGALEMTLTVISRLTEWVKAGRSSVPPPSKRRLEVTEWAALLDSIATTLTSREVIGPVAELAGVDPITVRQPRVLHIVSGPRMPELLPAGLSPIRGGGVSHGAHMLADPALDLSNPAERGEQVDRWLNQMGSDAGLFGMEQLVAKMREQRVSA
jgi:hypothetical protein